MFMLKIVSMKLLPYLIATSLVIGSCSSNKKEKEDVDGGPCSYEDKFYPAKLVKLEASADNRTYNGWLEIDSPSGNGTKDTISYLRMTNRDITREQLQRDSIATGNIYKYVVSTIKTGACNPDIRTIRLDRY